MDLSKEQTAEIVRYGNGRWDSHDIVHCPCGGTRQAALKKAEGVVMISVNAGCDLALEYRWKYMERGLGWAVRGRSQHGLLDRALRVAFTKKTSTKLCWSCRLQQRRTESQWLRSRL
jgi:hypothetical protein